MHLYRTIIVAILISGGCAEIPPEPFVSVVDGKEVMEYPGVPCPLDGRSAGCHPSYERALHLCTMRGDGADCFRRITRDEIYYVPSWDKHARQHETEHMLGMLHGPWRPKYEMRHWSLIPVLVGHCAMVIAGGKTQWKVGQWMCRFSGPEVVMRESW